MLRRYNTGYDDGNYNLVAGHLEGAETFREALVREAQEEAGIHVEHNDLQVVHVMHRWEARNPAHIRERIDIFLQAEKWQGEIKNMESHKHDDLDWFPIDEIPNNTSPYIKQFIENYKQNNLYSEFGFQER